MMSTVCKKPGDTLPWIDIEPLLSVDFWNRKMPYPLKAHEYLANDMLVMTTVLHLVSHISSHGS